MQIYVSTVGWIKKNLKCISSFFESNYVKHMDLHHNYLLLVRVGENYRGLVLIIDMAAILIVGS